MSGRSCSLARSDFFSPQAKQRQGLADQPTARRHLVSLPQPDLLLADRRVRIGKRESVRTLDHVPDRRHLSGDCDRHHHPPAIAASQPAVGRRSADVCLLCFAPPLYVVLRLHVLMQLYLLVRLLRRSDSQLQSERMVERDRGTICDQLDKFVFSVAEFRWRPRSASARLPALVSALPQHRG